MIVVRKFLHQQYMVYLAEYLVVKRASMEPNNHKLYLAFVEQLGMQDLDNYIMQMTYNSVKLLLQSAQPLPPLVQCLAFAFFQTFPK